METKYKKYVITHDCFEGNKGDIIEINWNSMDGATWINRTQNTMGNPFGATKCIKEVQ